MRRRAYLYFVLTFVLGVIVGSVAFFTYAWNSHHWRSPWNQAAVVRGMKKQLNLSPEQVQQLNAILSRATQKFHALQEQVRPQFTALHHETANRIRQILTPVQVKAFNAHLERIRKARQKRRKAP